MTDIPELKRPFLARCDDRSKLAKTNQTAGGPADWLNKKVLEERRLHLLTFDFFVDWRQSPPPIKNRIWIKRLVKANCTSWPTTDLKSIQSSLDELDGSKYMKALGQFGKKYDFLVQYMLFNDSEDWSDSHSPLVVAEVGSSGQIVKTKKTNLQQVKRVIKACSGGPVTIGSKGLVYGTSRLECSLSKTDSLWPGDADGVLLNENYDPVAILEYKKHTKSGKIPDQKLSNYYPRPDKRKYDRLVSLRNYLNADLPIVVIYYPTKRHLKKVKIEIIEGTHGNLQTVRSGIYDLPSKDDTVSHKFFLKQLINEIRICAS